MATHTQKFITQHETLKELAISILTRTPLPPCPPHDSRLIFVNYLKFLAVRRVIFPLSDNNSYTDNNAAASNCTLGN